MFLAHGAATGLNFEALVLALPMVVVGVILFVQKTAKPIVPVVLVLGGLAAGVGGMTIFAGDDHEAEASTARDEAYARMVTGLCEARRLAGTGVDEANVVFQDEVHGPLHDLAAEVREADRSAAAALLVAKEAVESDLESGLVEGDDLEQHLAELLDATAPALAAVDVEAPAC